METAKTKDLLIIFTKNLRAGKVKTRLAAKIGNEPALEIYNYLVNHTVSVTANLQVEKRVYYSSEVEENDEWEKKCFSKHLQRGKDLGERMENAFREAFRDKYDNVIIIGTDLLEIKQKDLETAFRYLREKQAVIGPAKDGGYYLLGLKSLNSKIFRNKKWSTASVFQETLKDLEDLNLKILDVRNDIDEMNDIAGNPAFKKYLKNHD